MSWQLSPEGKSLIGCITLKRGACVNATTTTTPNSSVDIHSSSSSTIGSTSGGGGGAGETPGASQSFGTSLPNLINQSARRLPVRFTVCTRLGLKIVGGRFNPATNTTSAFVAKVKKNSLADTAGAIQPGDEVLTWNGLSLRGLTYDEVYSLMCKSRADDQVTLGLERHSNLQSNQHHHQHDAAANSIINKG